MAKNLVLLLDGTWNNSILHSDADSSVASNLEIGEESTNIARMWLLLEKSTRQRLVYQRGVATDGDWGDKIDGWLGVQVHEKVNEALEAIRMIAKPGDRLYLFGFSRGAATARMVTRQLEADPLLQTQRISVPFMGVFDTVASMGFPGLAKSDSSYLGYRKAFHDRLDDLAIPSFVYNVVHIVATHEDRSVFAPTFAIAADPDATSVKEVWMGGNHGDIGGGWTDAQEQDKEYRRRMISLRYMLSEAKSHGLLLLDDWDKHPDVRIDEENHWHRCGQIHGWKDYPFFDRIHGRMTRSPDELPHGASTPIIHESTNK